MAAGRPPHAGSLQPRKQGTRQATGVSSQTTCSGAQSRGVNIVAGAGMELGGPAGAAQRRAPALGRRSRDAPRFTPNRRGVPKKPRIYGRFTVKSVPADGHSKGAAPLRAQLLADHSYPSKRPACSASGTCKQTNVGAFAVAAERKSRDATRADCRTSSGPAASSGSSLASAMSARSTSANTCCRSCRRSGCVTVTISETIACRPFR